MSISYTFSGKRVLITGGALGIGRALVQRFHESGAVVFTIDKNVDAVAKLKEELPTVTTKIADLANWEETKQAVKEFGDIDHLVNNAGIIIPESFLEVSENTANNMFAVHVGAVYNVSQLVAKNLIGRGVGGSIVNVSSLASRRHFMLAANYGPVKAAVENLTKSMAVELGAHNIRVNCILPGFVDTHMSQNAPDALDDLIGSIVNKTFGKRSITPNEIADLVIFLLSPLSTMVIGQGIVIDGGLALS